MSAPSQVHWGSSFNVRSGPNVPADSAVLVAPGTTTHGDDSTQRVVPLAVQHTKANVMNLAAPPNSAVAPPGYYMLFVLHQGIPSIASWVQLTAGG